MPDGRVLIIGAGIAGLAAAGRLTEAGRRVLIVDKGRSVGGRLATRRFGGALLDHGAQFFTTRSEAFTEAVAEWVDAGVVSEWCRGFGHDDGFPRYRAEGGMNRLAKHLAGRLEPSRAEIVTRVRVQALHQLDEGWVATYEAASREGDDAGSGDRHLPRPADPRVPGRRRGPPRPADRCRAGPGHRLSPGDRTVGTRRGGARPRARPAPSSSPTIRPSPSSPTTRPRASAMSGPSPSTAPTLAAPNCGPSTTTPSPPLCSRQPPSASGRPRSSITRSRSGATRGRSSPGPIAASRSPRRRDRWSSPAMPSADPRSRGPTCRGSPPPTRS